MATKKYVYHVKGMHCTSCSVLIEHELLDLSQVSNAKVSLDQKSVEIEADFKEMTDVEVMEYLNVICLSPHGYMLSVEKDPKVNNDILAKEFMFAVPIALAFILGFIFLQKIGIVNLVNSSDVTYSTSFVVGLIASVSTCMAVVGGLVLSMSTAFAKEGDKFRPQILFHIGRLVSFFVLGGVIGALGSFIQFGASGISIMNLIVALVLIVVGINLLDIFPFFKKIQPTIPAFIGKKVHSLKKLNHTLTPLILGVATFFLPCGFTQSMQIYSLTTGSFVSGALTMFAFALGTLPVLAILSFSSIAIHDKIKSRIFFKSVGLIIIFFGLINLLNSLVVAGIISPIFNL